MSDLTATLEQLTADQAERLIAVIEALDAGSVHIGADELDAPCIACDDRTEAALLVAYETKAERLAAGRQIAALHGLTKPRSAAAVAGDPVLSALLLSTTNHHQGANQS